ncbi:redox-sensing transcriptional repressor Rex [Salinispira pacifica]|uniref:Redox-sensing transcriptional repressor Rex n=1 Tax=Salinispira pacifica TaxID=1307761 RepID=V5WDV8_9SPIO|nr:redox-sensing transcriptional repressor Rex [Salinispira pacifica]AHC13972.1 Redox-sensitive transcriptional regulator, AT-rich DNA-binding protein [Salinispira pacifica]
MSAETVIPLPSIRRFPGYYYTVTRAIMAGETHISTSDLARRANLTPIQVRKDIEYTGVKGRTRIGYPCDELEQALGKILGLEFEHEYRAVLIGVGSLGGALLGHRGFQQYGIRFEAAFDIDVRSEEFRGIPLYEAERMGEIIPSLGVEIAVLTVPQEAASAAAQNCVSAGIRGIWNFSGASLHLELPPRVLVRNIDLGLRFSSFFAEFHHLERDGR